MANNDNSTKIEIFSKDNPIVEISSKQNTLQIQNVTPPVMPKQTKNK